ncbi:MAG: flagellar motor protein MotB [Sphingomonadaceae bacterium]
MPSSASIPAAAGPAPVIVRKVTVVAGGHHGGAWKVAYADFVTAMMAFFLLLWLLGATTETQRKGLADYFTPTLVKMREQSAGADGMLGGSSITEVDNYPNRQGQTGNQAITIPRSARGGPEKDGSASAEEAEARRAALQARIEQRLHTRSDLSQLVRQVRVVSTRRGVRIDLMDDADFSMFALGTTVLVPEARELIGVVAEAIGGDGSRLIVRGHTDALPWRAGSGASNWSLSAGRAEATRQELRRSGIAESRFERIEGVAEREPLLPDDPADPRNRRMSLLVVD